MISPQTAFTDYQAAKSAHKTARDAYNEAKANNKTLADLDAAKKQAAAEYAAEKEQFDANHSALVETVAEKKAVRDEASLLFDETVEMAVRRGEQLSLFDAKGREVSVRLTTRTTIEKDVKKKAAESTATEDAA